jgi:hypothetical protein
VTTTTESGVVFPPENLDALLDLAHFLELHTGSGFFAAIAIQHLPCSLVRRLTRSVSARRSWSAPAQHYPSRIAGTTASGRDLLRGLRRNERDAHCRDVVMTEMIEQPVPAAEGDRELTAEANEELELDELFTQSSKLSADDYPRARTVSGAFMFKRIVRAQAPAPPEYISVPFPATGKTTPFS